MAQLFSNNFITTITGATDASTTSITLTDASDMNSPTGGDYELVTLYNKTSYEIVKVTAVSGNVLTVVRAQESTTGLVYVAGDIAFSGITAGTLELLQVMSATESFLLVVGDETTALTTGAAKLTFRIPYSFTLIAVRASVTTAPTDATIIIDINESGTSVLSTLLTIDSTDKTSTVATAPAIISDANLDIDAEITIDIDQVGSTIAGAGLKITLIGARA